MIKYSNRGLVHTNGTNRSSLFNRLYFTSLFTWSLGAYVVAIIKASELKIPAGRERVKIGMGLVFLLAYLVMFLNIQYIRKKRPISSKIQYNIVTFNQSFVMYILFYLSDLILKYLRQNCYIHCILVENDYKLFFFLTFKLIFFNCLIPCTIIRNLNLTIPILFSEYKVEKVNFYMSEQRIIPRQQVFLPLKQFKFNARFGSEKKFQNFSQNQTEQISSESSLPVVEC